MKITEIPAKPKERKTIRVAAYARVSSDKDAAFHSLEAQTEYYEEYIAAHPDWELVSIYSDNGISGTIINRPEFQRMLEDCRAGKIDLVVTKSVTRFARNTVVLLETVRGLKKLGIDCYFEKEDMHSISPDGELLLTLLAMYAEEEARSASENQKWRIRKMFEEGRTNNGFILGYRLKDGKYEIIPEEAEIVRLIFRLYLSGMGKGGIARYLTQQNISTLRSDHWNRNSIKKILENEKYTGNMMLQKTYCPDFRVKMSKANNGELRKYYVEDSHEAIIDRETFDAAQKEAENRRRAIKSPSTPSRQSLFAGIVKCGICGRNFCRTHSNKGKYKTAVWGCNGYLTLGKIFCPSQKIPEDIFIEKTKEVLKSETLDREMIVQSIRQIIVPAHNVIVYILNDGTQIETHWKHHSRSESWTPEMRKAARERTQAYHRKEKTHAQSNNH